MGVKTWAPRVAAASGGGEGAWPGSLRAMRRPPRLCEAATRRRAVQQRAGTGGGSAAAGGGESPPPPAGPGSSTRDRKGP